jgi:hypothetical protein
MILVGKDVGGVMSNATVTPEEANRAWQAMLEGRFVDALRMLDDLDARDPGTGRYSGNRGMTRLCLGDVDGALADFLALRDSFRRRVTVEFVGAVLWLQGKRQEACDDWHGQIEMRRSGVITHADEAGGVAVPALLWWASLHAGFEAWREPALEELRRRWRTRMCRQSRWPGSIAAYLLGHLLEDGLFAAVPESHIFRPRWLCQAHFYVGATAFATGAGSRYRKELTCAASQEQTSITAPEYFLARSELALLNAAGPV